MFEIEQSSLFTAVDLSIDRTFSSSRRRDLGSGAWVDYAPGWLSGDERLFALVAETAPWTSPEVRMYDRMVRTPRLTARADRSWHPILDEIISALSTRYGVDLDRISAGLYRDGGDSVAFHGDRVARQLPTATVATVSLAGPRRFLLRPRGGGTSVAYSLGHGDLIVMGGSCQRTWEHAVPKVNEAPPRIALMFRPDYGDRPADAEAGRP